MLRPTAALADFISSTEFEDLPSEVVEKAKHLIIDTIGVAIAGTKEGSFRAAENFVREMRGSGASTAIASGLKTNAEWAVLTNGIAAHALDFDDWHSAGGVHPGCVVIPAALAAAEEKDSSGKDFLKSVIVGYETVIRVGMLCGNRGFGLGFHPTATCGVFGALAAVSSVLGLDAKQVENGFGIATSLSGGVQRYMQGGASIKHLHAGWSAHSGTIAAKLAALGYEAPKESLEGEYGFCYTHGQHMRRSRIRIVSRNVRNSQRPGQGVPMLQRTLQLDRSGRINCQEIWARRGYDQENKGSRYQHSCEPMFCAKGIEG